MAVNRKMYNKIVIMHVQIRNYDKEGYENKCNEPNQQPNP
jgi:hypothetical protein